jgi:hypothetical protein
MVVVTPRPMMSSRFSTALAGSAPAQGASFTSESLMIAPSSRFRAATSALAVVGAAWALPWLTVSR